MIDYRYTSNTLGASANQLYFEADPEYMLTGRVFYKITQGGEYRYSLLFNNIIDSTYSDGSKSKSNRIMKEWTIHSARYAKYSADIFKNGITEPPFRSSYGGAAIAREHGIDCVPFEAEFQPISFDGKIGKRVSPGEIFETDEFEFYAESGEYICIELVFSGTEIPYHEESLLPIYRFRGGKWFYDKRVPLPACIGCDRTVNRRIGFWGDSITQGIGTRENSYLHWNARLAEMLGNGYSYWNLGIGYARADDAASAGIWLEKALLCDILFVCLGVNDLLQGLSADDIKRNLFKTVTLLKDAGKKVILQTLPPFDYCGNKIAEWEDINEYILTVLNNKVDFVFDCVEILGAEEARHNAKYGGHPNENGCEIWAEALFKGIKQKELL